MSKLVTNDISNVANDATAVSILNSNFARIETAVEKTLFRDGTYPNHMESSLDMNGSRIYNLPRALGNTDPVRKAEFDATVLSVINETFDESDIRAAVTPENPLVLTLDFGVVPGLGSDQSTLIQAAFTAAKETGRPLYCPPGVYRCDSSLSVDTDAAQENGPHIYGAGEFNTIFDCRGSGAYAMVFRCLNSSQQQFGTYLHDFSIVSNGGTGVSGIQLNGVWNAKIENVRLFGLTGNGINIHSSIGEVGAGDNNSTANIDIRRCYISDCDGYGIAFTAPSGSVPHSTHRIESGIIQNCFGGILAQSVFGLTIKDMGIVTSTGDAHVRIAYNGTNCQNLIMEDCEIGNGDSGSASIVLDGLYCFDIRNVTFTTSASGDISGPGHPERGILFGTSNECSSGNVKNCRVRLLPHVLPYTQYEFSTGSNNIEIERTFWNVFDNAIQTKYKNYSLGKGIRIEEYSVPSKVSALTASTTALTPNLRIGKYHRIDCTASPTINAPVNTYIAVTDASVFTDGTLQGGEELVLVIFNNSAGDITPTFNAVYKTVAAPTIPSARTYTAAFFYDNSISQWVQVNDWVNT